MRPDAREWALVPVVDAPVGHLAVAASVVRPELVARPVVAAVVVAEAAAGLVPRALSGVPAVRPSVDASRRSSAGRNSTRWRRRALVACASVKAMVRSFAFVVARR